MGKRLVTLLMASMLVGGVLAAVPARAEDPPATTVPEVVNIEDPSGDANGLNDQGTGAGIGDNSGGAGIGAGDILKVWFSNDATKFKVHINTTFPPPNATPGFGLLYRVFFNEVEGCDLFEAYVPANTFQGEATADLVCAERVPGELVIETLEDGTGIVTLSFDRPSAPVFADGAVVGAPSAMTRGAHGTNGAALLVPVFDTTLEGTDYTVVTGAPPGKPAKPAKPAKPTHPTTPVKKGCSKGKGKKKGCTKGTPKPEACVPFAPGDAGKDQPTVVVSDMHTAEAPLVQTVTLDPNADEVGATDAPSAIVNVQVDPLAATTGLYATLEFPERRDYDLWALWAEDGSVAASSHGFSAFIETQGAGPADQSNTATNYGGETTSNSENLVGIITPDCGGYTINVENYLGEGGDLDLKLYLGEGKIEPQAPGEETR